MILFSTQVLASSVFVQKFNPLFFVLFRFLFPQLFLPQFLDAMLKFSVRIVFTNSVRQKYLIKCNSTLLPTSLPPSPLFFNASLALAVPHYLYLQQPLCACCWRCWVAAFQHVVEEAVLIFTASTPFLNSYLGFAQLSCFSLYLLEC